MTTRESARLIRQQTRVAASAGLIQSDESKALLAIAGALEALTVGARAKRTAARGATPKARPASRVELREWLWQPTADEDLLCGVTEDKARALLAIGEKVVHLPEPIEVRVGGGPLADWVGQASRPMVPASLQRGHTRGYVGGMIDRNQPGAAQVRREFRYSGPLSVGADDADVSAVLEARAKGAAAEWKASILGRALVGASQRDDNPPARPGASRVTMEQMCGRLRAAKARRQLSEGARERAAEKREAKAAAAGLEATLAALALLG